MNMIVFGFFKNYLKKDDEVLITLSEHASNIVPWFVLQQDIGIKVKYIELDDKNEVNIDNVKEAITDRTRVISIAHVTNVIGDERPIRDISKFAHDNDILLVVDAAQSIAHQRIDVQELDIDFMAFSGHKMYGPTGLGVLYGKKEWLDKLPPAEGGGEMIEHVSFEKTTYNVLPYKFEAGTPNYVGSYAFGKSIDYVQAIGLENIAKHEHALAEYIEQELDKISQVKVYAVGKEKAGAVSFNVYRADGALIHPFDVGVLLDRQGVAVRTGHHCAEPLIDWLGVPGTVRASVGLYNTKEDVDVFISALKKAIMMLE
jgi:cysteine desulfurase/selenocysteine lyase